MPIVVTSPVTAVVVGADSLGDGSAGAPVVSFLSDQTTGVYLSAGATVGVACGGLVKFEFSATALNCHDIALTNVGNITCKSTGKAIINLNAVTGIAAGVDVTAVKTLVGIGAGVAISAVVSSAGVAAGQAISAVGTFAGIGAGAVCTAVASIAGVAAGMALTAVASSAGIAAGQAISAVASVAGIGAGADITATKTLVGIAAGVDITAVKSLAFIAGTGVITNCSSTPAIHAPVANIAALTAVAAGDRSAGMLCMVLADTASEVSLWRFHATSTAADTSVNLVAVPDAGSGRWLRADKIVNLYLAATFATADNATLFTVPIGARLRPLTSYWDIGTTWAGGTNSAIGVHASPTGWATKGDILGGAAGDLTATLVSTNTRKVGTAGAKQGSADFGLIMIAADTLRFDRIVDVYTSGVGKVRVPCELIVNPGA